MKSGDDQRVRSELEKYLGVRYKRGGTSTDGFDCSGFARTMYRKLFGIDLPHNAQSQFQLPQLTKLGTNSLRTGDLVFFSPTTSKKRINHVGIYLNDGQFIHAESNRGIIVSSIDEEHWRNRLVSAKSLGNKELLSGQSLHSWSQTEDDVDDTPDEDAGLHVRCKTKPQQPAEQRVALKSSRPKKPQSIALDYVRPVFGKYCNLQVGSFRDDFDIYNRDADMAEGLHDPTIPFSVFSYTQGLRIASDIKPCSWMSITPSYLYYNQGRELEYMLTPAQSVGLDMSLGSLTDAGWSLATGLKYETLNASSLHRTARAGDPSQLDLSLTYSQQLTKSTQFSLMGQRLQTSYAQRSEQSGTGLSADQRLFFMLNYSY